MTITPTPPPRPIHRFVGDYRSPRIACGLPWTDAIEAEFATGMVTCPACRVDDDPAPVGFSVDGRSVRETDPVVEWEADDTGSQALLHIGGGTAAVVDLDYRDPDRLRFAGELFDRVAANASELADDLRDYALRAEEQIRYEEENP